MNTAEGLSKSILSIILLYSLIFDLLVPGFLFHTFGGTRQE